MLTDLEGIAPCMPGAQLTGVDGDVYKGKVKVKVGPVISEYAGTAPLRREGRRRLPRGIDAKGRDSRGAGNASAADHCAVAARRVAHRGQRRHRPEDHRQDRPVRQRHDQGGLREAARPVRRLPRGQAGRTGAGGTGRRGTGRAVGAGRRGAAARAAGRCEHGPRSRRRRAAPAPAAAAPATPVRPPSAEAAARRHASRIAGGCRSTSGVMPRRRRRHRRGRRHLPRCAVAQLAGPRPRPCCAASTGRSFAVAFALRLRRRGVPVGLTGVEDAHPGAGRRARLDSLSRLYWVARISLVRQRSGDRRRSTRSSPRCSTTWCSPVDPHARPQADRTAGRDDDALHRCRRRRPTQDGAGLPWATLPPVVEPPARRARPVPGAGAAAQRAWPPRRRAVRATRRDSTSRCSARGCTAALRQLADRGARGGSRSTPPGAGSRCGRRSPGRGGPAGSRSTWSAYRPVRKPRRRRDALRRQPVDAGPGRRVPAPDAGARTGAPTPRCSPSRPR